MDASNSNDQTESSSKQWSLLPDLALVQVFRLLKNNDRISAGSTCHRWRSVQLQPEFFREKKFDIDGGDRKEVAAVAGRALSYMQNYGRHLRHLILEIGIPSVNTYPTISKSAKQLLTSAQPEMKLSSLSCDGILLGYNKGRSDRHKNRIVNAFANFLAHQSKYLVDVNLRDNFISLEDSLTLLRALATSTDPPARLTILDLSGFFKDTIHMEICPEVSNLMGRFSALRTLILDFPHLTDNVLEQLSFGSPLLEMLSLNTYKVDWTYDDNCASTSGWRAAVQRLPKLQVMVDMGVDDIDVEQVLVDAIPLVSLSVHFKPNRQMDFMASLILHLCQHFAGSLELFHTSGLSPAGPWTRPRELVELVTRCTSLNCLAMERWILSEETLMEVAAARAHSASLPRPVPLQLHLGECNHLGNRVLQRLSENSCFVRICHQRHCNPEPYKAQMGH